MLRRIVSLGQQVSESEDDFMSPPSNDAGRSSESKVPGGLAGVFKGLTGSKLTKAPAQGSGQPTTATTISPLPLTAPAAAATLSSSSIASTQPTSEPTDTDSLASRSRSQLTTYADCLDLLKNGTLSERVAAASALRSIVIETPVQSMSAAWNATEDLIDPSKTQAARHAGWELLAECARHTSSTNIERRKYFQAITAPADPSDFHLQLSALIDLTNNGRNLSGFDYDVFPILTEWFQTVYKASKVAAKKPSSARSANGKGGKVKGAQTTEERNLSQLFAYTIDVIKYSSKIASDSAIEGLLDAILDIAMNTSTEDDLSSCIAIINTCVTVGAMPSKSLERCVKVLSSIYCLVPKLQKTAWQVLSNIFKSHHGLHTISILLDTLRKYPLEGVEVKDATREVRGALSVLQKLVRKAGSPEYPALPYTLLVDGLENVVSHTPSPRIVASILQLINQLFESGDGSLNPLLLDEDWASLLSVATTCAKRSSPSSSYDGALNRKQSLAGSASSEEPSQDAVDRESAVLTARLESLLRGLLNERPEYMQRNCCVTFLADVHHILPDSGAEFVLKYFAEFSCCFPSDPQWDGNLKLVLDAFYSNQARSAVVRLQALQTAIDVHNVLSLVDGVDDAPDAVAGLVRRILARIGEERDTILLFHAISFAVMTAPSVDAELFHFIIEALGSVIKNDEARQPLVIATASSTPTSPLTPSEHPEVQTDQSTSNIATRGLVQIFMDTMNTDAHKASTVFEALISLARDKRCPVDARLSALKLLFRLRADWAHRIFLVSNTESEGLAAVLFRTEASLERKMADEVTQEILARQARNEPGAPLPSGSQHPTRPTRGVSFGQGGGGSGGPHERPGFPSRTASNARHRTTAPRYRQLWSLPDTDALPQTPIANASTVLFSHEWDENMISGDAKDKGKETTSSGDTPITESETSATPGDKPEDKSDTKPTLLALNMTAWMEVVFDILTRGANWELYSFALIHLPSQLSNHAVCRGAVPVILRIRAALCDQVRNNNSQEPPAATGLRRPDVQTCVLQTLTMILSYHEYFQRQEGDDLVRTFITGLTDKNPISCVHALSICCYELPNATSKSLVNILTKMSQIITRPGVAVHILELLACLSRLPWLYSNFREDEYRIAFGVCFRYLQAVRDRRKSSRVSHASVSEQSSVSTYNGYGMGAFDPHGPEMPGQTPMQPNTSDDLPQYVYALAYHVLTFWFLALRVTDRAKYVTWIASRLFIDNDGRQITDEQAQITLDFMQRVAFSDADESAPAEDPDEGSGQDAPPSRSWVMGNSILTIQPAASKPGFARITKRQPSGTSYYTILENLQPPPPHQTRGLIDPMESISGGQAHHNQPANPVLPSHLLTQLLAPVPQQFDSPLRPILLPNDEATDRAFRAFDRNSTVDGHKVGVIYIGEGQTDEADILANVSGSSDYVDFLNGLGTLVRLKGATFNTQGLDREYDTDGAYTYCWRDRVTEIVFHVTTQMPTDRERDPICIGKKRHIGNDYVNIIFNDSGLPFKFDTFPSEFNYVNIVITPESRASFVARRELSLQKQRDDEKEALAQEQYLQQQQQGQTQADESQQPQPRQKRAMPFYKVQVMSKPGFPEISPSARTKIISLKALPDFIRLLALNASVFSQVWATRQGGEHISSWRNRLRQIHRLRERYGPPAMASVAPSPPPSAMAGGPGGGGPGGGAGGPGNTGAGNTAGGGVGNNSPVGATGGALAGGVGASASTGTGGVTNNGPGLTGGNSSAEQLSLSRSSVSGMRDSFNSLRRTSMATFFTVSDPSQNSTYAPNQNNNINNNRISVHSTATGTTGSEITDATAVNSSSEIWVDSLDFSKWA